MAVVNDGMGGTGRRRFLELTEQASLYVECLDPMGHMVSRATGFVVRDRAGRALLVTNRHVVTGRDSLDNDKKIQLRRGGEAIAPSALRIALPGTDLGIWKPYVLELGDENEQPTWLEHSELGWRVDVVAIPINIDEAQFDVCSAPLTPCPARLRVTSQLFVVGFPMGFDPFTAVGATGVWTGATVAWQPELDWRDLPAILVDGRTRKGQSGAPVWFVAHEFAPYRGSDGSVRHGPAEGLVGVYGGRIQEDSDIGIVWKRKALEAIIEAGTIPATPFVSPFDNSVDIDRLLDPDAIREDKARADAQPTP